MSLKTVVENVIVIDSQDLDEFIKQEYGRPFNSVEDQAWNNNSSYFYNINDRILSVWNKHKIDTFKEKGFYHFTLYSLLLDLCKQGKIAEGKYLIKVEM